MEDWAEIRRLHKAEGMPIKAIVRHLGVARNTVRAALASDAPPSYQRASKGSLVDAVEPEVRKLLRLDAKMPATVIAERIGWEHSLTILKDRIRQIRPEYAGVDPADRIVHEPGQAAQMDLWFPEPRIPVGFGQAAMLPVLVMTLTFSRFLSAVMLPSRQAGDLLAGQLISQVGAVSKTLVWDREAAIGGKGVVTQAAAAFAGTLATRVVLAPPRDPEFKGMTERNNGYLETSIGSGATHLCVERSLPSISHRDPKLILTSDSALSDEFGALLVRGPDVFQEPIERLWSEMPDQLVTYYLRWSVEVTRRHRNVLWTSLGELLQHLGRHVRILKDSTNDVHVVVMEHDFQDFGGRFWRSCYLPLLYVGATSGDTKVIGVAHGRVLCPPLADRNRRLVAMRTQRPVHSFDWPDFREDARSDPDDHHHPSAAATCNVLLVERVVREVPPVVRIAPLYTVVVGGQV